MSAKKKTTSKKTPAKKAAVKKAPAKKKAVAKKVPAKKKATARKKAPVKKKTALSAEERYQRIQFEAYLMAEKNGFTGDASGYWSEAEKIVDSQFA